MGVEGSIDDEPLSKQDANSQKRYPLRVGWLGKSRFLGAESLILGCGLRLQGDTNSVLNTTEYARARI